MSGNLIRDANLWIQGQNCLLPKAIWMKNTSYDTKKAFIDAKNLNRHWVLYKQIKKIQQIK